MTDRSIRSFLKEKTDQIHNELDAGMSGLLAADNFESLSYEQLLRKYQLLYRLFLEQASVSDVDYTKPMLQAGLEHLRVDLANSSSVELTDSMEKPHTVHTQDRALGRAYVLLGSTLGGIYLAKQLRPKTTQVHFFLGEGKNTVTNWREFLSILEKRGTDRDEILNEAIYTFRFLQKILH